MPRGVIVISGIDAVAEILLLQPSGIVVLVADNFAARLVGDTFQPSDIVVAVVERVAELIDAGAAPPRVVVAEIEEAAAQVSYALRAIVRVVRQGSCTCGVGG